MFYTRKSKFFALIVAIGVLSIILSIICATFLANKENQKHEIKAPAFAPVVISKSGVLNFISNEVKVTAISKGKKVQLGIGKVNDVQQYAKDSKTPYAEVDRFKTDSGFGLLLHDINNKHEQDLNLKSDMWFAYAEGENKANLKLQKNNLENYAFIAATDGRSAAPKIILEWKVDPYCPYSLFLFLLGIILSAIGAIGLFYNEIKAIFVKYVVVPLKQRREFNKAITQVDYLKVSEIKTYGDQHMLQNDEGNKKTYPSRKQLREARRTRKWR